MKLADRAMLALMSVVTLACLVLVAVPFGAAALGVAFPAAIAAEGQVVVPYGDWLSAGLTVLNGLPIASVVIGWFLVAIQNLGLPAQVASLLKTMITEQMLGKAIDYALNAVAGATKGRALSVSVSNDVLRQALGYVVDNAPGWLTAWLGGPDGIRTRILARLQLGPEAKIAQSGEIVPAA